MLQDLVIGQYIPGVSFLYRLDPRTKMISLLIYVTCLLVVNNLWGYIWLGSLALLVIVLTGKYMVLWRGIRPIWLFLIFTIAVNLIMTPGNEAIFRAGPFTGTTEGLVKGLMLACRLLLMITMATLLTLTTPPTALSDGLIRILGPTKRLGVPVAELAMMLTIALRFIPTIMQETEQVMRAQQSRGAVFDRGPLTRRLRNWVYLLVPLFVGVIRRAEELSVAMEARGYHSGQQRTQRKSLLMVERDYWALAVMIIFLVGAVYFRA